MVFDLLALAALSGQAVVAAASTDAWESAKRGFARLLGRGDPQREEAAERQLEQTREHLRAAPGQEVELARARQQAAWQARLFTLLEERPEVAGDLMGLVEQIRAQLPAGVVLASDHAAAAGRDMNIGAAGGSVAAAVIHGNVGPPANPTQPGPAQG